MDNLPGHISQPCKSQICWRDYDNCSIIVILIIEILHETIIRCYHRFINFIISFFYQTYNNTCLNNNYSYCNYCLNGGINWPLVKPINNDN